MLVKAVAHVRNEDMRRLLNKSECEPGDVFDLPDGLAEIYLTEGWVLRMNAPAIETAMLSGAPETAARKARKKTVQGSRVQGFNSESD